MAELISLEYRVNNARKGLVARWCWVAAGSAIICGAAVAWSMMWAQHRSIERDTQKTEYSGKQVLIQRAQDLRQSRLDLASRMEKIEQLMGDKMLLEVLRNISESFSDKDCLDYISIDTHGKPGDKSSPITPGHFAVHMDGVTMSSATLAELMTRLKVKSTPAMSVTLESSHRETIMAGQLMRFQITCERADASNP